MIYSPGTATRVQPEWRCQVNLSHTPERQVNNLFIFHICEVFSQLLQFIPKSLELKLIEVYCFGLNSHILNHVESSNSRFVKKG